MHVWMDGWMDASMLGWMDACMDGCMHGWMHACMDGWIDGWMDACMDGWMHAWMDGWMHVDIAVCVCSLHRANTSTEDTHEICAHLCTRVAKVQAKVTQTLAKAPVPVASAR